MEYIIEKNNETTKQPLEKIQIDIKCLCKFIKYLKIMFSFPCAENLFQFKSVRSTNCEL